MDTYLRLQESPQIPFSAGTLYPWLILRPLWQAAVRPPLFGNSLRFLPAGLTLSSAGVILFRGLIPRRLRREFWLKISGIKTRTVDTPTLVSKIRPTGILRLCKTRPAFLRKSPFGAAFLSFSKNRNSGLPYPQKPPPEPLTLPLRLRRVCNRVATFDPYQRRGKHAAIQ